VVGDLAANIKAGQGLVDSVGFIMALIGLLFAHMAPAVTSLGEKMDDIEEDVLDGSANALREQIVSIRKKASHYLEFNQLASEMVTAKSVSLLQKISH
jgi:Mg2+ and Co2+ transporter CorA